jgi:hypothetical protein
VLPVGRLLRVVRRLLVRANKRDVGRVAYVPFFLRRRETMDHLAGYPTFGLEGGSWGGVSSWAREQAAKSL